MSSRSDTSSGRPIFRGTVGTAGHIDHGKTLLVERLTGMRADRPYERERGMTIDIGYAEMAAGDGRRIGFVDLPGHERFIRNMVAGATGVDLALLVVAADDGVMPQTREHVEILGLLGIRRAIVVLNKIDAVEPEMCELALEELREFLAETSLRDAPVLACSAMTGAGIDALRAAILAAMDEASAAPDPFCFFLAVQRTFAAAGFGCIVTGVPASGSVRVGDELELLPEGRRVRVRAIEVYHEAAEVAASGHRTALNLAGVHHDEAGRGMAVARPGSFLPTRHVAVELTLLASARRALRHGAPVRLLTGTLEEMATVHLLTGNTLRPGEKAIVELRTRAPVAVHDGASFILRSDNAKETLGGGRIVAALDAPPKRRDAAKREELEAWARAGRDPMLRVRTALGLLADPTAEEIVRRTQLAPATVAILLAKLCDTGELVLLPGGGHAPAALIRAGAARLREALASMHREQPLLEALPVAEVRDRAGLTEAHLPPALALLEQEVLLEARTLRLASHRVQVDGALSDAAERVIAFLRAARFAPPPSETIAASISLDAREAREALTILRDRGVLRAVAPGLLYPKEILEEGIQILHRVAQRRGGTIEPVDAKAALGDISRKWLIPLLEYYDRLGATRRNGNERAITRRGEAILAGGLDAH